MMARLGVSPLISTVVLIALVMGIAALMGPWMFSTVNTVTNQTSNTAEMELICQRTSYDFDTGYGTFGVDWNLAGASDSISVRIVNTGNTNLYNFSFELETNRTIGTPQIKYFDVNSTTQRTAMNPLKPGQSVVLEAAMDEDLNGTLTRLKVLNPVCSRFFVEQEF